MPDRRIRLQRDVVLPRMVTKRDFSLCVIAIEGEKTEKQYFQKFGGKKVKVDILPTRVGHSSEPEGVMERLRKYKQENDLQEEDRCWLVFDVDDRDSERLKTVCAQAKDERFTAVISNPCFEFWLFLHKFDASELDQSIQQVASEKRSQEMKQILKYNYHSLPYKQFREDVERAVQQAKSMERSRRSPVPKFPGTDVYKIVESLPLKAYDEL